MGKTQQGLFGTSAVTSDVMEPCCNGRMNLEMIDCSKNISTLSEIGKIKLSYRYAKLVREALKQQFEMCLDTQIQR